MTRRLAFAESGAGPAAVLLVHGQPGDAADWHGVAEQLRERFRVIGPARPGYGATGGEPLGIRGNADALSGLLGELGIESVTVVGHSWGTAVALALARDPRVDGVVLVAPISPVHETLGRGDRALANRRAGPVLVRLGFAVAGAALALPPARALLGAALPGRDARAWGQTARRWRSDGVARAFWHEQRMLIDELPDLAPEVRPLDVPAAVVVGRRDVVTRPATGRALARDLGARLVEVPGVGHLIPQRMPEIVASVVTETAARAGAAVQSSS